MPCVQEKGGIFSFCFTPDMPNFDIYGEFKKINITQSKKAVSILDWSYYKQLYDDLLTVLPLSIPLSSFESITCNETTSTLKFIYTNKKQKEINLEPNSCTKLENVILIVK